MKKISLFLVFILFGSQVLWLKADNVTDCDTKIGFEVYNCREKEICEPYNLKKPVYPTEKYEDAKNFVGAGGINKVAFTTAKSLYKKNISNIYKCSIIDSQRKSLKKVRDILVKIEKSGTLEDSVSRDLELKLNKLDLWSTSIGCGDPNSTDIYSKLNILKETTLEMCKYVNYLEYLKIYYTDIKNLIEDDQGVTQTAQSGYPFDYIGTQMSSIQQDIQDEIWHTFKVAWTVFNAYSEYETNLPIHIFLQIIKNDYMIIRDRLYQALSPINQVVYKISNAMKK